MMVMFDIDICRLEYLLGMFLPSGIGLCLEAWMILREANIIEYLSLVDLEIEPSLCRQSSVGRWIIAINPTDRIIALSRKIASTTNATLRRLPVAGACRNGASRNFEFAACCTRVMDPPRDLDGYGSVPRSPHRVASSHLKSLRTKGLQEVLLWNLWRSLEQNPKFDVSLPHRNPSGWCEECATRTLTGQFVSFWGFQQCSTGSACWKPCSRHFLTISVSVDLPTSIKMFTLG